MILNAVEKQQWHYQIITKDHLFCFNLYSENYFRIKKKIKELLLFSWVFKEVMSSKLKQLFTYIIKCHR